MSFWHAGLPRVGLGAMRLSTTPERDEARAAAVLQHALEAGVRIFDTARAYGLDEHDLGHNERLLARALAAHPRGAEARVVTKGGMRRQGPRWIPDGRASTLLSDAEASAEALGGHPVDLFLVHAPDPKTPWATTLRALADVKERGLAKAVGVSNVSYPQLEEALGLAPLVAVELGLSLVDDAPLKSGVVRLALTKGLTVLCHSPLGGPKRYAQLSRESWLHVQAERDGCSAHEWALAALLALHPGVVVLPGARRVETVDSCVRAEHLTLPDEALRVLRQYVEAPAPKVSPAQREDVPGEVVVIMGLQGAGKSSLVAPLEAAGYGRLNRDTQGGTMAQLHATLRQRLLQGHRRLVLDNTYVLRALRREVVDAAHAAGLPVRGVWLELSAEQAQVNVCWRMLEAHGRLLEPTELLRGANDPTKLVPRALFGMVKTLEPVGDDEGFDTLERRPGFAVPLPEGEPVSLWGVDVVKTPEGRRALAAEPGRRVVVGWVEDGHAALALKQALPAGVEAALCAHPAGPPTCWCRPPLPGLFLELARHRGVGLAKSALVTASPALESVARVLGVPLRAPPAGAAVTR